METLIVPPARGVNDQRLDETIKDLFWARKYWTLCHRLEDTEPFSAARLFIKMSMTNVNHGEGKATTMDDDLIDDEEQA